MQCADGPLLEDVPPELEVAVVVPIRRKREPAVRSKTISIRRLSKTALERGRVEYPPEEHWRPRTRGDCDTFPRPCPFVACRYHLYADVHATRGSIKINFPDREPDELDVTCSLDVADAGGQTLEDTASLMNLTRERVRQYEEMALAKLPREWFAKLVTEKS